MHTQAVQLDTKSEREESAKKWMDVLKNPSDFKDNEISELVSIMDAQGFFPVDESFEQTLKDIRDSRVRRIFIETLSSTT